MKIRQINKVELIECSSRDAAEYMLASTIDIDYRIDNYTEMMDIIAEFPHHETMAYFVDHTGGHLVRISASKKLNKSKELNIQTLNLYR